MSYSTLLDTVSGVISGYESARDKFAPRLAPGFNTIQQLRPNENTLTAILENLLNPRGNHAQKTLFLNKFLCKFINENNLDNSSNAKLELESRTHSDRRIDLVVDLPKFIFAIENKPWATDQKDQVSDYLIELKERAKNGDKQYKLLYISFDGAPPGEDSINSDLRKTYEDLHQFKSISYTEIKDWLLGCKSEIQAPVIQYFIAEFCNYIETEFQGIKDMELSKELEEVCMRGESLKSALEIGMQMPLLQLSLVKKLKIEVESLLKAMGWDSKVNTGVSPNKLANEKLFTISFPDDRNRYQFAFQFESKNFDDLFLGICICDGKPRHDTNQFVNYLKFGSSGCKANDFWVFWKWSPTEIRNWGTSVEPWLQIQNGVMAQYIVKEIINIKEDLEKANLWSQIP